MSDYYNDVYLKRLNRYGMNYQARRQAQREKEFEDYLLKSSYRIDFEYDGELQPGTFEKNNQDETEASYYLLTRKDLEIPAGTMLSIKDAKDRPRDWLVWYPEDMQVSGYNRYMMLRMTHHIYWLDTKGDRYETSCYMYGQQDNMLKDEIRSRSRMDTLYAENLKLNFLVMPRNQHIEKNALLYVGEEPYFEQYRVTGYDIQSTPGVMYVSADPTYTHDVSAPPQKTAADSDADFYWLDGGES